MKDFFRGEERCDILFAMPWIRRIIKVIFRAFHPHCTLYLPGNRIFIYEARVKL